MTSEAPSKDTRSRIDVLVEYLNGADRVVIETKNALGEMDAGYLHAPAVLHGLATLTAENAALKARVEALERALRFIGCSETAEGRLARAALSPEKEG